jgi:hypothetical protein
LDMAMLKKSFQEVHAWALMKLARLSKPYTTWPAAQPDDQAH